MSPNASASAPRRCHARNPRLVYGRMTGWGQEGPLARRAGHDIAYVALTGTLGMIGRPGHPAAAPANLLGDYAGGSLYLVVGVLAALHHARRDGRPGRSWTRPSSTARPHLPR